MLTIPYDYNYKKISLYIIYVIYNDLIMIKQEHLRKLQESTGPGRYLLNTPDVIPKGLDHCLLYCDDPHIRLQGWGGNLREYR